MTHTDIGIAAAFGACVLLLALLLVLLLRRAGRRADARVDEVVRTLEFRMDELAQELAGAVERAEEEGRRSRFLGEIAGSIDLDEVLARTLEAASKLPGADAALIRLEGHDKPIVATLGLSAEEAERQAIAGPPDGRPARSIEIVYRYPEGLPEAEELVHSSPCRSPTTAAASGNSREYGEIPRRGASTKTTSAGSRSSPSAQAPRSTTRAASGRRASSPTSTA